MLRGHASKNAKMQENLEHLCKSNRYITTLHVINSSIVKLGKLTEATKVYRGVSSGVLPPKFWEKDEYGLKADRRSSSRRTAATTAASTCCCRRTLAASRRATARPPACTLYGRRTTTSR